jgi:predicted alpha/beta hydrolase
VKGDAVAEASPDDVFVDDIMVPASDGYMLAATLYLPRGTKHDAVLINSATAVPRKIYRGFATYLAGRGSVVLTYDYRGIGGSRPSSLKGFAATMSDWAALDVSSAVTWMRGRYKGMPLAVVGHSFGGQAIGLLPNNDMIARSLLVSAQAGHWALMTPPENYRAYAMMKYVGRPITRLLGYTPREAWHRRGPAEGRVLAVERLGHEQTLLLRRYRADGAGQLQPVHPPRPRAKF